MAQHVIWVIDTSSIIEIRRSVENSRKVHVFSQMGTLVNVGKLTYPKEVVGELGRAADPVSPDAQFRWAKDNEGRATESTPSLDEVKEVLRQVPKVLNPDKDTGVEEADPYVLALAVRLRAEGKDARVVTEEVKEYPGRMSLRTAAGLLGVPSVPLKAFLEFERIA